MSLGSGGEVVWGGVGIGLIKMRNELDFWQWNEDIMTWFFGETRGVFVICLVCWSVPFLCKMRERT